MSYSSFRNQNTDLNTLKDKFSKLNGKTTFNDLDETYWTTTHVAGPDGVGEAIIRFLPSPPDGQGGQEPDNIVKYFTFSHYNRGKYYNNRGRNSLGSGEADPANEYNMSIWARKDIDKEQKKKLLVNRSENYVANIFIVKDPNKPENEGKVFRWKFGPMIYNKINGMLFPEYETDKPVIVFDPIDGADFAFRISPKTVPDKTTGQLKKISTYENSKFLDSKPRWTLDEFDAIWAKEHSLQSEIAPDKFKDYDQLKKEFDRVMGTKSESNNKTDEPETGYTPALKSSKAPEKEEKKIDDEITWLSDEKEAPETSDDDVPWDTSDSKSDEESVEDWFSKLN